MSCEKALLLIIRALDNDLNSFEEALLEDHLASCPNCAQQAQEIIEDQANIQAYFQDLQPLSPDFTEKVMSQVRKQPQVLFWNSPLLKVASVAVLLGGISFFAYAFSHSGGPEILAKKPETQLSKLADEESGKQARFSPADNLKESMEQKDAAFIENTVKQEQVIDTAKKAIPQNSVPIKSPEPEQKAKQPVKQDEPQEYAALRVQPEAASAPDQMRALMIAPEARKPVENAATLPLPTVGYLPSGYHLAHQSEEKDSQGKVTAVYLYYLPQDEKLKPNNGLPWPNYLSITLEEGSGIGEKENFVFTSPQGEKEVQRSLSNEEKKLQVVIKSKGIREWELIKVLDSIQLPKQD